MRHLRHPLLWLCSFALVFVGVLGRGFVLCVDSDGGFRVEASGVTGTCVLNADRAHTGASRAGGQLLSLDSACGGCDDVTIANGSTLFRHSGTLFESIPLGGALGRALASAWLVARVDTSSESAARATRLGELPLGPRSSDLYAVRETVIFLI